MRNGNPVQDIKSRLVNFSNCRRISGSADFLFRSFNYFFQAAQQANVSSAMMISWIWGISIGAAVAGIYLSIRYKLR